MMDTKQLRLACAQMVYRYPLRVLLAVAIFNLALYTGMRLQINNEVRNLTLLHNVQYTITSNKLAECEANFEILFASTQQVDGYFIEIPSTSGWEEPDIVEEYLFENDSKSFQYEFE